MGGFYRVINRRYTFYLTAKSIYYKPNDNLSQKFEIMAKDGKSLSRTDHLELVDAIYRKKIVDTSTLGEFVLRKFRVESTSKKI